MKESKDVLLVSKKYQLKNHYDLWNLKEKNQRFLIQKFMVCVQMCSLHCSFPIIVVIINIIIIIIMIIIVIDLM